MLGMINCEVFKCKFRLKVSMKGFDSDIYRNSKWTHANWRGRWKIFPLMKHSDKINSFETIIWDLDGIVGDLFNWHFSLSKLISSQSPLLPRFSRSARRREWQFDFYNIVSSKTFSLYVLIKSQSQFTESASPNVPLFDPPAWCHHQLIREPWAGMSFCNSDGSCVYTNYRFPSEPKSANNCN